jgi:hypothetical protein
LLEKFGMAVFQYVSACLFTFLRLPFGVKRKAKPPTFAKATADKARLAQFRLKRKILPLHPQNSPWSSWD